MTTQQSHAANNEFIAGGPVVLTTLVGMIVSLGVLIVYPFGLFFAPLQAEFGWGRGEIAGALIASQASLALTMPLHGWLIDRIGARPMAVFSILCMAGVLSSLYFLTPSLTHLYAVFFAASVFGASASPVGYVGVLIRYFDCRRGLALGLALTGVGLGASLAPLMAQHLIGAFGWRAAYIGLGLAALIPLPLVLIFLKLPRETQSAAAVATSDDKSGAGLLTFLLLALLFLAIGGISIGAFAHIVPVLTDQGFTPARAASFLSIVGVSVIVGRMLVGWLLDHISARIVMSLISLGLTAACMLLHLQTTEPVLIAAVILLGLGVGAEVDLLSYLVSRYWTPASFGRLYGALFGLFAVGTGFGPWLMGYGFDLSGGYRLPMTIAAGAAVLVAALCFALPPYRRSAAISHLQH